MISSLCILQFPREPQWSTGVLPSRVQHLFIPLTWVLLLRVHSTTQNVLKTSAQVIGVLLPATFYRFPTIVFRTVFRFLHPCWMPGEIPKRQQPRHYFTLIMSPWSTIWVLLRLIIQPLTRTTRLTTVPQERSLRRVIVFQSTQHFDDVFQTLFISLPFVLIGNLLTRETI